MWKAIVYDLDGTLVDSGKTVAALLNGLRAERQLPALDVQAYTPWLSVGGLQMVAAALHLPEAEAAPFLQIFRTRYLAETTTPDSLYPGIQPTLAALKNAGVSLAVCTNKPRPLTDKVLADTGLTDYFEVVCAGQDLPCRKPHPDTLLYCLNTLGVAAKDSLLVGDSRIDQQLAKACGASFAFFSPGYDDGVEHTAEMLVITQHPDLLQHCHFS